MVMNSFGGPAGCGKTHRLMDELVGTLEREPLESHQRVLAITFMYGSRRWLESRLSIIEPLRGRYEAVVLDGFAWRLIQRWRRLIAHLGFPVPQEHDFDACCAIAAKLVAIPIVAQWVKSSFPIIIVDETQDLCVNRSAIVSALSDTVEFVKRVNEQQLLGSGNISLND